MAATAETGGTVNEGPQGQTQARGQSAPPPGRQAPGDTTRRGPVLIDTATYRRLTGDTTTASATVDQALADAQSRLEDTLGRRGLLEHGEHTETLPLYPDGTCYPTAVPVEGADGTTVYDDTIYGASPTYTPGVWTDTPSHATVTYTGGISSDDVPGYMAADLAWCAYELVHGQANRQADVAAGVAGATSVRLGDASVQYGPGGRRGSFQWSAETLRHKRVSP